MEAAIAGVVLLSASSALAAPDAVASSPPGYDPSELRYGVAPPPMVTLPLITVTRGWSLKVGAHETLIVRATWNQPGLSLELKL